MVGQGVPSAREGPDAGVTGSDKVAALRAENLTLRAEKDALRQRLAREKNNAAGRRNRGAADAVLPGISSSESERPSYRAGCQLDRAS